MGDIKEIVGKAMVKKEVRIKTWKIGMRRWWDRECAKKKRKVKESLRQWRRNMDKEEYFKERREWRSLCEEKKRYKKEEELEKLRKIKHEGDVWKYLNKFRKKREERHETQIGIGRWKEHFRDLLGGCEEKIVGVKSAVKKSRR